MKVYFATLLLLTVVIGCGGSKPKSKNDTIESLISKYSSYSHVSVGQVRIDTEEGKDYSDAELMTFSPKLKDYVRIQKRTTLKVEGDHAYSLEEETNTLNNTTTRKVVYKNENIAEAMRIFLNDGGRVSYDYLVYSKFGRPNTEPTRGGGELEFLEDYAFKVRLTDGCDGGEQMAKKDIKLQSRGIRMSLAPTSGTTTVHCETITTAQLKALNLKGILLVDEVNNRELTNQDLGYLVKDL